MNKKDLNKKRILIFSLMICLLIISVSYSVLAESLNIKGIGTIDSKWDVSITDIYSGDVVKTATNLFEPKILSSTSVSFGANLLSPNDSITYTVTIENKGTIDAVLEDIVIDENSNNANSNIRYKITGVEKEKTILNAGTKNVVKIIVYFNDVNNIEEIIPENKSFSINFIYKQKTN